jgi:hypothetical protein
MGTRSRDVEEVNLGFVLLQFFIATTTTTTTTTTEEFKTIAKHLRIQSGRRKDEI